MKKIILFFSILILWAGTAFALPVNPDPIQLETQNGSIPFFIEVAATQEERNIGLMNRERLGQQSGMLFDFHEERNVSFWMRNTLIGLDMIFISEDGIIKHIHENAIPLDETPIPSTQPVRYVLEINGGLSSQIGLKAGDKVFHPLIVTAK